MAWRGFDIPPLQNLSQSWLIFDLRVGSSICVHHFGLLFCSFILFVIFILPFTFRPLRCAFSFFTAKGAKTAKIVPDWYVMLTPNFLQPGYLR